MLFRSVALVATLAFSASATHYQNNTKSEWHSSSKPEWLTSKLETTISIESTVYTTVCPATSIWTEGTKTLTSTYITTSTVTSCKGGCSKTTIPATTTTSGVESTIYTTICPATSTWTEGTKTLTLTYITTSTLTSCKGGCTPPTSTLWTHSPPKPTSKWVPGWNQTTTTQEATIYTTICPATSTWISGSTTLTSTYITTSTITSCKGGCPTSTGTPNCEKVRSDCQSKPGSNQSYCAALYAECADTTSGLNKPPRTTVTQDTTIYTTVCAATSIYTYGSTTLTSTYITTSTITSCKGGCQPTVVPPPVPITTQDTTTYTTVCPVTSMHTSGSLTSTQIYTTTSIITSCKGGCYPTIMIPPTSTTVVPPPVKPTIEVPPVKPTTVITLSQPTSIVPPPPSSSSKPVDTCQNSYEKCRGASGSNQSYCASQFAACKGVGSTSLITSSFPATTPYSPEPTKFQATPVGTGSYTPTTSGVFVTNAAGVTKPACAGLLVAGAFIALL
ncbi:hypothetical protein BGZ60DRAFT_420128 [Tricladium varicosporioides]|nr:hypothetical protein BGZ60DRAFT_420128 [Hymenoscyphus varicosporioides]